jgi:hypothetical protein
MNRIIHSASLHLGIALLAVVSLAVSPVARAASNVAIVQGSFYTSDLYGVLTGAGVNVTEITDYTAASLAPFTHVIHYGNSFTDMTALTDYVNAGGTLIEQPWFWSNNSPPDELDIFNTIDADIYITPYPGINAILPAHPLLDGVSFPPAPSGFDVGYDNQATFAPGVTGIANWTDGSGTAMLGEKSQGAGRVIGINVHVITSDTAYQVIHQPFATRLLLNAVGVPEPSSLFLAFGACLGLPVCAPARRCRR